MQSTVRLDAGYISCATCKYWTGRTEYLYPGLVIVEYGAKGKCVKTFLGAEMKAMTNCSNWERRYD